MSLILILLLQSISGFWYDRPDVKAFETFTLTPHGFKLYHNHCGDSPCGALEIIKWSADGMEELEHIRVRSVTRDLGLEIETAKNIAHIALIATGVKSGWPPIRKTPANEEIITEYVIGADGKVAPHDYIDRSSADCAYYYDRASELEAKMARGFAGIKREDVQLQLSLFDACSKAKKP